MKITLVITPNDDILFFEPKPDEIYGEDEEGEIRELIDMPDKLAREYLEKAAAFADILNRMEAAYKAQRDVKAFMELPGMKDKYSGAMAFRGSEIICYRFIAMNPEASNDAKNTARLLAELIAELARAWGAD